MNYIAPAVLMLLFQALPTSTVPFGPLSSLGVAGVVIYLWQMDRKERRAQEAESRQQYQELAKDFRQIVQENTRAVQAMTDSLTTARCPLAGGPLAAALRGRDVQEILSKFTQAGQ